MADLSKLTPKQSASDVLDALTSLDVTHETQRLKRPSETQEIQRDPARRAADADSLPPIEDPEDGYRRRIREYRSDRAQWFGKVVKQPFDRFMVDAYHFWRERSADEEEWKSVLFWFAWIIRGHTDMQRLLKSPAKAISKVETVMRGWTQSIKARREKPPYGSSSDPWMDWFGVDRYDARAEFVDVWQKARFLPGHSPLQQAFDEARRMRLLLSEEMRTIRAAAPSSERDERDYEFFISLAGHLQVAVGDQPIKLPCDALAVTLGVSKMTISRYRRWAIADKFIAVVKEHTFRSKGRSDATEFRFDVRWYSALAEKAQ